MSAKVFIRFYELGIYLVILLLSVLLSACDNDTENGRLSNVEADQGLAGPSCGFDQDNDYPNARQLRATQSIDGQVCPLGDVDWYQLSIEQTGIISIEAKMETPLSPLNLSYELYRIQNGETRDIVAQSLPTEASTQVKTTHCVAQGNYGLRVSDLNGDAQDKQNYYELSFDVSPDPDQGELEQEGPAEGVILGESTDASIEIQARPLQNGMESSGFIACRGDQDWFKIDLEERVVLNLKLSMPLTQVQPQLTLYSPSLERVLTLNQANAALSETQLERDLSLTQAGTYYIHIEDMSGLRADLENAYTLQLTAESDNDLNEPNNVARLATSIAMAALECGSEWSPWIEKEGVVGTLGDIDWFAFETAGCQPGILEVELDLNDENLSNAESFELQRTLELSVNLVEAHEMSMCQHGEAGADESCRLLSKSCSSAWDCAGISRVCLPEGVCAGSVSCLPSNRCAASKIERHYVLPENATELALPPHRVRLTAPLTGDQLRYLRVGDYGGNSAHPQANYTLKMRIRREPDQNEPSNIYTDEIRRGDRVSDHLGLARSRNVVYVHDHSSDVYAPPPSEEKEVGESMAGESMAGESMAGESMAGESMAGEFMAGESMAGESMAGESMAGESMAGESMAGMLMPVDGFLPTSCSSPNAQWTEGVISYEDDQDFYSYRHPCPGEDCMVKIYYEIDEGPVDFLLQVYQHNDLWFDPIVPVSELNVNAAISGVFGGLNAGDQCFYAWQGHGRMNEDFYYTLSIRDLRSKKDWSSDQKYRFCIEKAGNGCFEPPCENREQPETGLQDGGCSVPRP